MIATDRDALCCDLAETYGIFDMRALPATVLATLAVGLREDSRIKLKMSGLRVSRETVMQAAIVDRLSYLLWFVSGNAKAGANQPKSMVEAVLGIVPAEDNTPPMRTFESGEAFAAAWKDELEGCA